MELAEVVGTADQRRHPGGQHGLGVCVCTGAPPADQWCQGGAEGGIEPFDIRCIDPGAAAGRRQHCRNGLDSPPHHAALSTSHASLDVPLDHLVQEQPCLQYQSGPSPAAGSHRVVKCPQASRDVPRQDIDIQQHGQGASAGSDHLYQCRDQDQITSGRMPEGPAFFKPSNTSPRLHGVVPPFGRNLEIGLFRQSRYRVPTK